jgi:2-polyprenyl-6-methoxyphenol hydroxylase-like FAD-dependent oxidoreductase
MEHQKQIVIIGAGYAGMMAALRLANQTRRQPMQLDSSRLVANEPKHRLQQNAFLAFAPGC